MFRTWPSIATSAMRSPTPDWRAQHACELGRWGPAAGGWLPERSGLRRTRHSAGPESRRGARGPGLCVVAQPLGPSGAAERSFAHAIKLNPRYGACAPLVFSRPCCRPTSGRIAGRKPRASERSTQWTSSRGAHGVALSDGPSVRQGAANRSARFAMSQTSAWHHVFYGWALLNQGVFEEESEIARGAELASGPHDAQQPGAGPSRWRPSRGGRARRTRPPSGCFEQQVCIAL